MSRRRPTWVELPDGVRRLVAQQLGSRVVAWTSNDGGYSPGPALTLTLANGERVFVKGADAVVHPDAGRFHRREAEIAAALPAGLPTPAFRWAIDTGDWIVLAFDAVTGRPPVVPWVAEEVDAVAHLVTLLAQVRGAGRAGGIRGSRPVRRLAHSCRRGRRRTGGLPGLARARTGRARAAGSWVAGGDGWGPAGPHGSAW